MRRILIVTPNAWRKPGLVPRVLDDAAEYLLGHRRGRLADRAGPLELVVGTPPVEGTGELEAFQWADRHHVPTVPHPPEYDFIDRADPIDMDLARDLVTIAAPDLVVAFDRFLSTNWDRYLQAASVTSGVETWRFIDNAASGSEAS